VSVRPSQMPHGFRTRRLHVQSWAPCLEDAGRHRSLIGELTPVLTPEVLRQLPEPLQISDGPDAVAQWVSAREAESDVFTVRDDASSSIVGLLILAEFPEPDATATIHLGYLFAEDSWGKGYATELLLGLVLWLGEQDRQIRLIGGVEKSNIASARVLQKAGFEESPELSSDETIMFSRMTR